MKIIELEQVSELLAYGARAKIPPAAIALTVCFANRAHTSSVVDDILAVDWLDRTLAIAPSLAIHKDYIKAVGEEIRNYWGLDPALQTTPKSEPAPFVPIPSPEIPVTPSPDPTRESAPVEPVAVADTQPS